MSDDPRFALIESGFDDLNAGNVEGVFGLFHPEVEIKVVHPLANAGTWRGHEGLVEMVASWHEPFTDITYEVRRHEVIDERHTLTWVHQESRGVTSGVPVELEVVNLFEIHDDKAIRFEIHPDRESALSAI